MTVWNDLPQAFRDRTARILSPDDVDAFSTAFKDPPLTVRWTGAIGDHQKGEETLVEGGFAPSSIEWCPGAWRIDSMHRRALSDFVANNERRLIIQSLSSIAAVMAMDVHPGQDILDLCAAPGAKTSLIHQCQQGRGMLIANELSRNRTKRMAALLRRQRIDTVELLTGEGQRLGRSHANCFDRVLADVPCSGEGRFRAMQERSYANWSIERIERLADRQFALLEAACRTLRPGGEVVYATCTLAPEENEGVVDSVLRDGAIPMEARPLDMTCASVRPPLTSWNDRSYHEDVALAARIVAGEGMTPFFLARLRRR